MSRLLRRFLDSFTPGVRVLLGILAAGYVATIIGHLSGWYQLEDVLMMNRADFLNGRIWQVVTYVVVPGSSVGFLMNVFAVALLGASLERIWPRWDLWIYSLIAVLGTGLVYLVAPHLMHGILAGASPLVLAFLVAWGFVFRHERLAFVLGEISVGLAAGVAVLIDLTLIWAQAGSGSALVLLGGGILALLYLWLMDRRSMTRPSRTVSSGRINQLEI